MIFDIKNFLSQRRAKKNRGYSLVEMLFYIFILVLLLLVIVGILTSIVKSQRDFKASRDIENAAVVSLERITREIRNASSITSAGANNLLLNITGGPAIEFFASSTVLSIKEGGVYVGPLTPLSVSLTNLMFRPLNSGNSSAVKIEMTLQSGAENFQKSASFYSTAVLRGSY